MEVEEDTDVFEINDFTNASQWEQFIAQLEEVFRDWNFSREIKRTLHDNNSVLAQKGVELEFAGTKFKLTYYFPESEKCLEDITLQEKEGCYVGKRSLDDMMVRGDGFPARAHPIQRWYWLQQFAVLEPLGDVLLSADRAAVLLSSLATAAANTQCCIPLFSAVERRDRRLYEGLLHTPEIRVNYEMLQLLDAPSQYSKLNALVHLFRNKLETLGCSIESAAGVSITARLTYALQDWAELNWPAQTHGLSTDVDEDEGSFELQTLGAIPFGCVVEPVTQTLIFCTWYDYSEKVLHENELSSDLDAMKAPEWSMRVACQESADGQLGNMLTEMLRLCRRRDATLAPLQVSSTSGTPAKQALHRLANTDFQEVLGSSSSSGAHSQYLPTVIRDALLQFLFPDASGLSSKVKRKNEKGNNAETDGYGTKQLKSAPVDSLTWRLAAALVWTYKQAGWHGCSHLWHEVILELRHRWDNGHLIPDLLETAPDLGTCLLHQKLQMLNCCIRKKKEGELQGQSIVEEVSRTPGSLGSGDEQDEFFECSEDLQEQPALSDSFQKSRNERSPEGRLQPCGALKLLSRNEPLYVPLTQEPAPLTEDELEEQASLLARLGTDTEGQMLRAKMQSRTLVADMEAFKAANPGCVLADFVRWYSPRDFIEAESSSEDGSCLQSGTLSARMELPGNAWSEAWQTSQPIPARRQKRLFDETREAEKVLQHFASLAPGAVASLLLPVIINAALCELHARVADIATVRPSLASELNAITTSAAQLTRQREAQIEKMQDLLVGLGALESRIEAAYSLRHKLLTLLDTSLPDGLLSKLLVGDTVQLPPDPELRRKLSLVLPTEVQEPSSEDVKSSTSADTHRRLAAPHARELLLRAETCCTGTPAHLPQRMYAVLSRAEFRLAAAFSQPSALL